MSGELQTNDIKEMEVNQNKSPAEMIQAALTMGGNLDKLEQLLALQKDWEANEARKAYHVAMAEFKKNPPSIEKDKKVGYDTSKGKVGYSHASLANVVNKITEALSRHGLSASWNTKQDNGTITVTCRITHAKGHSEETILTAPPDATGSKNTIQAIGSTITYLERYTILMGTGLAAHDQDDDGVGVTESISDEQLHKLRDLLLAADAKEAPLCKYLSIETLEVMPKGDYQKAVTAIEARIKAGVK